MKRLSFWSFILFMLALTGLFALLGFWQFQRLAEKEALIASVDSRLTAVPYDLPPSGAWSTIDADIYAYHPLTIAGTLQNDRSVLVFTNLPKAKGRFSGPGFWMMTPVQTDAGIIFVNRGFVPQASGPSLLLNDTAPAAAQTFTGIAIAPETASAFTPGPDTVNRIEWIRDPVRLADMAGIDEPVFPLTLDLPAGEPGALPQGGETIVEFPNNHLGYALTWFGFALITPILLAFWIRRQLQER